MKVCIQDPANYRTYLLPLDALAEFEVEADAETEADVLLMLPSDALIQELPASRLSDSPTPSVQIVDTDGDRAWRLDHNRLQEYSVPVPPSDDGEEIAWFAMPSAREVLAAVPIFRKALVPHSS